MAADQPKYQEIADRLKGRIQANEFVQLGNKLPAEEELTDEYGVSRNTIRQAVGRLSREGLVVRRQGQGTFVKLKVDPFVTTLSTTTPGIDGGGMEGATYLSQVTEQHRVPRSSKPKIEIQECPEGIALSLGIETGDDIISRHQRRFIDDVAWSLQTSFYPFELSSRADRLLKASDIEEGTVKYLAETWGLDQVGYRDWIQIRPSNEEEQGFFGLGTGEFIVEVFRTAFARATSADVPLTRPLVPDGYIPTRVTVTVYPVDRNLLVSDHGEVPELYEVRAARERTGDRETPA